MTLTPEMVKIEPCPFCGRQVELGYDMGNEVYSQNWFVQCKSCGATQGHVYGSNSWGTVKSEDDKAKQKVITSWNARAQSQRAVAVPDALPDDAVIFGDDDDDGYRMGWNACRESMLSALIDRAGGGV